MAESPGAVTPWSSPLTEPELEAWGRDVGRAAVRAGDLPLVLALRGPLGAGKSVLSRAIARGAGVRSPMPSPTYNLLFTYSGNEGVTVHHLDLYRLESPDDVWELGWEELGTGAQLVLIEWPDRAEALLPSDRWDVMLEFAGEGSDPASDPHRRVRLVRRGRVPELPGLPNASDRATASDRANRPDRPNLDRPSDASGPPGAIGRKS